MPGRSRQVSLADLAAKSALPELVEQAQAPAPPPVPALLAPPVAPAADASQPTEPATPAAASDPQRRAPRRRIKKPVPGEWIRYDEYERKEARLRPDQYGRLSDASRALNRARNGTGERITENTLIRVAIDLLLVRDQELVGTTEAELRKSVGL